MRPCRLLLIALFSVVTVAGCSTASDDELLQWMAQQKSQTLPKIASISEPKQFQPESYTEVTEFDPFSIKKLTMALKNDALQSAANRALLVPELARRKEPLEEFPLDTIKLVGSMVRGGKPVALVTVDKLLYQVRPGEYLGQNFGRITKMSETEVTLREIVQDATGEWIERTASLQLQERPR